MIQSLNKNAFIGSLAKKATSLSIPIASLKFPPVTSLSYSSARAKDWDDIITGHSDETYARTWTILGKKLGKYSFGFADNPKSKGQTKEVLGSVKACTHFGSSFITLQLFIFLVCVCDGVRQLRYRQFINWTNPYVEHAVRH